MLYVSSLLWVQTRFNLEWQKTISVKDMEGLREASADQKTWKTWSEIWLYHILLCESERESDFDIFGCTSECETIRLVISLVCLICNISLLRETRRFVVFSEVSMLWSPGRAGAGAVQCLDRSPANLSLDRRGFSRPVSHFNLFSEGLHVLPRPFCLTRGNAYRLKHHLCKRYCHRFVTLGRENKQQSDWTTSA